MLRKALFVGLIVDERGQPVGVALIGNVSYYVVDDEGFLRHVPSESVDRQVLTFLQQNILANRDAVVGGMLQYMGKDDLFTKAAVEASIEQMDENLDQLFAIGLPDETRQWLGLMGFQVVLNIHGDVVGITMPGAETPEQE